MKKERTILFLYTRLPDYFYQCVLHFVENSNYNAVIVRYKGDSNTMYSFLPNEKIVLKYKDGIELESFVNGLSPKAIILSGWSDKDYRKIGKSYVNKISVVLALDNPWYNNLKQNVLVILGRRFIHSFSNCVWVAGVSQAEYARRLGFRKNKIFNHLYCADTEKFYAKQPDGIEFKNNNYPKRIVFVGRLVEYKRPHLLAKAFNKINQKKKSNWTLVLAGEGPLKEVIKRERYPDVELIDFIDPSGLQNFYSTCGLFCLPSKNEHWGVAVHEAAAAGLPLLLSDSVESGSEFLINGYNGFSFITGDENGLEIALESMLKLTDKELMSMSRNSIELSKKVNHKNWSEILSKMVSENE